MKMKEMCVETRVRQEPEVTTIEIQQYKCSSCSKWVSKDSVLVTEINEDSKLNICTDCAEVFFGYDGLPNGTVVQSQEIVITLESIKTAFELVPALIIVFIVYVMVYLPTIAYDERFED